MPNPSRDTSVPPGLLLLDPSFFANPHDVFHRLRAEDPVHWSAPLNLWVLTRHEDIQALVRDPRFTAERSAQLRAAISEAMLPAYEEIIRFLRPWLSMRDPPDHTRPRALLAKAFTPQIIEDLAPTIQRIVDEMLDVVVDEGEMELVRDLAFPLPAMVIAGMLGVPRSRIDAFKKWTDDLFGLLGAGHPTDEVVANAHAGVLALDGLFRGIIAERRREPRADMISQLLAVEEQGVFLSDDELISTCALLLIAGHETTTHAISNAVLALLRNPSELEKLRRDPGLIEGAVEELLRYESPVSMLSRCALADVEMGGKTIRAGEVVLGFIPAGNRDPAVFADPDRLDVTRKGVKSLAFGYGAHYCLGAGLARLEMRIALRAILARLPDLELASPSLEWLPSLMIHGVAALPLKFRADVELGQGSSGPPSWAGPASLRAPLSMRTPVSVPLPVTKVAPGSSG